MKKISCGSLASVVLVVILCMHSALIGGEVQKLLLETAYDMEMIDGSLLFVPYDALLYSLPHVNVTYPALRSNGKLLRAYDAVLTITISSPQVSFYEAYQDAMDRREVARTLEPQQVMVHSRGTLAICFLLRACRGGTSSRSLSPQVSPLFGTIYNSIFFMAHAVHRVRKSREWMSGGNLASNTHNLAFQVQKASRLYREKL